MKDEFKHNPDGVEEILKNLSETRKKYEDEITNLENLEIEISTSSSWKDLTVKTAFLNTYKGYLSIYKNIYTAMSYYEKYLEKKSKEAKQIEEKYTKVI